nr:excinuclease ABC subunit UvrA [Saprospiraceae bacterium]
MARTKEKNSTRDSGTSGIALPREIHIKGAKSNNLKNLEIKIPKGKLVVVCGLSGSGKSSLVMDTLYAEGQRRYVESLSSYARQFMERMKKPEVDFIKGLCPAIAVEQKTANRNARSTVGSTTEIYDFLRLLYSRAARTISPVSGKEVKRHQVSDIVDYLMTLEEGTKVVLTSPLNSESDRSLRDELSILIQRGFTRLLWNDQQHYMEDLIESEHELIEENIANLDGDLRIIVDRFAVRKEDEELIKRMADSVQTAFMEGGGNCFVELTDGSKKGFNNRFEEDGIVFLDPTPHLFNYNNAYGACPKCEGYGKVLGIDENKVIPNPGLSVYEGAVACWSGVKSDRYLQKVLDHAHEYKLRVTTPYRDLTHWERDLLWEGSKHFKGINDYFSKVESKSYKIQNRVLLSRYRGRTKCTLCKGTRLKKEALYVIYGGKNIGELMVMPIRDLYDFFKDNPPDSHTQQIAARLLLEIETRLGTMVRIGLGYLTLDRISSTLSGGELQRINLTRLLSSNLTQSLYILDEPSIGLHPKDTTNLLRVLKDLRDLSNTVIVVEHEEDIIRNADHIVEIGPGAGINGGQVVFSGPMENIFSGKSKSLTADYLKGDLAVKIPDHKRKLSDFIALKGARYHNVRGIDVELPLGALTVVTGVSGSGKSTLVRDVLYPALKQKLGDEYIHQGDKWEKLEGAYDQLNHIEWVSQKPIGRSSRSNPVTYIKAYDEIRRLMASQQLSKIRGFEPGHFSFNVKGGRCSECEGEGYVTVEMQFLADVSLVCEECKGKRFKHDVLQVKYRGKNIYDILELSVEEALDFFIEEKNIARKLQPLYDVGLGYIKLGQSSSTLSGGEAQRVKLASFMLSGSQGARTLFIFDEPTTGLHFHDINKLLQALSDLMDNGHTVLIIEHNLEVIKSADWIIDLGPEGGDLGGELIFQGTVDEIAKVSESHTGRYLKEKMETESAHSQK